MQRHNLRANYQGDSHPLEHGVRVPTWNENHHASLPFPLLLSAENLDPNKGRERRVELRLDVLLQSILASMILDFIRCGNDRRTSLSVERGSQLSGLLAFLLQQTVDTFSDSRSCLWGSASPACWLNKSTAPTIMEKPSCRLRYPSVPVLLVQVSASKSTAQGSRARPLTVFCLTPSEQRSHRDSRRHSPHLHLCSRE